VKVFLRKTGQIFRAKHQRRLDALSTDDEKVEGTSRLVTSRFQGGNKDAV